MTVAEVAASRCDSHTQPDCGKCHTWRCAWCRRSYFWGHGAGDAKWMLCDLCWCESEERPHFAELRA